MYPAAKSKAKVVSKGTLFVVSDYLLLVTVFIRGAPVEDNTTSEYICTVVATYGCNILQLYEYEVTEYGYKAKCE